MRHAAKILLILCFLIVSASANAESDWEQLPPTPDLPKAKQSGYAPVNGTRLWYAVFGEGPPVIMVHGGLANSNYWGLQVEALSDQYQVIVLDSRGHGRSYSGDKPISYDQMASDVLALMDYLNIQQAALVGWSDGGIIGLKIAMSHPERLTKLFAYGANMVPSGVTDISGKPAFTEYLARVKQEYKRLSPTPEEYQAFLDEISKMWSNVNLTAEQLQEITVPTWIVAGDHGIIKVSETDAMFELIPGAEKLILPGVGHFAFIQRPAMFNTALMHFLQWSPSTQ